MRYCGSKARFAKEIGNIILQNIDDNQTYVEPFCGGANMLAYINHNKKIASDSNDLIIAMWKAFQQGKYPPVSVSQETYYDIKNSYKNNRKKYPKWITGYVSNACSYGGKFFGGYARFNDKKNENHIKEAYNGTIKQIKSFINLKTTKFINSSYDTLKLPKNSVIYCDPPYSNTVGYKDKFDSDKFWQWCRNKVSEGHKVFISEYNAPEDFKCIWYQKKKDGMAQAKKRQEEKLEKLFVHVSQIKEKENYKKAV